MFVISPCSWVRAIKLAGGVDEETEVGAVPHQVGVADVVLDQAAAQDDHPCNSVVDISFVKRGLWWDLCWHSSLPICWSVLNHRECQPPSLANTMNNLCIWTKSKFLNWMPGFLKEWKKSISPRLPSVRAGEITGISFLCSSLNRNLKLPQHLLCSPIVYWRLIVDL